VDQGAFVASQQSSSGPGGSPRLLSQALNGAATPPVRRFDPARPAKAAFTDFCDISFPRIEMCRMMPFESQNEVETAMADAGGGAGIGGLAAGDLASGEGRPTPAEMAMRGIRILERLIAGSTLAEVAAGEGLSPRRARELVAEAVAQRGFDP